MPKSKHQTTAFYHQRKAVQFEFSGDAISSDGGILLLSKLERKNRIIDSFSKVIPDRRNPLFVTHTYCKQLEQRVFMMAMGYEDCNDSSHLIHDPLLGTVLEEGMCSQPTLSRMENNADRNAIWKLCEWWLDRYVSQIKSGRKQIIIDVDTTDDPTHGSQQLSLFHGYYWQFMYQELLFLDGETGQMILPVLLPGTTHPGKTFVAILERLVMKIRRRYPQMKIVVRADAGFSCPSWYELVQQHQLEFCLGLTANPVLNQHVAELEKHIRHEYLEKGDKHQEFVGPFLYEAKTWPCAQSAYAKVESTGKGMNIRFFVSNITGQKAEELYFGFYVRRGETCENRIKELKNMCYSDRLSCHRYWANFFRLMVSALVYEFFRLIKELIAKTEHQKAKTWLVDSIRLFLLKIGSVVNEKIRYIRIKFSRAFPYQSLLRQLFQLC